MDVYVDGIFQGSVASGETGYVPSEGFVTHDSGWNPDGTLFTQYSHGGWPGDQPIRVMAFHSDLSGVCQFWIGTFPQDSRELHVYAGGDTPTDPAWLQENAQKIHGSRENVHPATCGVDAITGESKLTQAGLDGRDEFSRLVGGAIGPEPRAEYQKDISTATSEFNRLLTGKSTGTSFVAEKVPQKGAAFRVVPPQLKVVNATKVIETESSSYTISGVARMVENNEVLISVNGGDSVKAPALDDGSFSFQLPLATGENRILVSAMGKWGSQRRLSQNITVNRKVEDLAKVSAAVNEWVASGGYGVHEILISPKPSVGSSLSIEYDHFNVPDKTEVFYIGVTDRRLVFETETSGGSGKKGLPRYMGEKILIVVTGAQRGTDWKVRLSSD